MNHINTRRVRPSHLLAGIIAVGAAAALTNSAGPGSVPAGACVASTYAGATGGDRIQKAIDDAACRTVSIDGAGPDASGAWLVGRQIVLRSNLVLESSGEPPATLSAIDAKWGGGLLRIEGQSDITIRRLNIHNNKKAPNGVWISRSHDITITQVAVTGAVFNGIAVNDGPSANISISSSIFENNGNVDIRTDTSNAFAYHSRVIATNNRMRGTRYGSALANCGSSRASACESRDNTMTAMGDSGVDLNRSRYAVVTGNDISNSGHGITVDDSEYATITHNTISGSADDGIQMANGAVAANRPWSVSHNQISNNVVINAGGFGLASYRNPLEPNDRNQLNAWTDNQISGNRRGGCHTTADSNTFSGNGPQTCSP